MQMRAMCGEPIFGALDGGRKTMRQRPEFWRVIEMNKMRHFMRRKVIEDEGRRED